MIRAEDTRPIGAVRVAELAVAADGTLWTVGLGSCVAIALHDARARVGGLSHILLPDPAMSRDPKPGKFPATAVPILLDEMIKLGASRPRVIAKLVGGATMFGGLLKSGGTNMGERNIIAVRAVLAAHRIPIAAEDTGGDYGRSAYLHMSDGAVEVRSVRAGTRVL